MANNYIENAKQLHMMKTAIPWRAGVLGGATMGALGLGYALMQNKPTATGRSSREEKFENKKDMLLKQKRRAGDKFGYSNKIKLVLAKAEEEAAKVSREHPVQAALTNTGIAAGAGAFAAMGGKKLLIDTLLKGGK